MTSQGSRPRRALSVSGSMPARDAFPVRKVRDAGALVLAKSNMAEFARSAFETVGSLRRATRAIRMRSTAHQQVRAAGRQQRSRQVSGRSGLGPTQVIRFGLRRPSLDSEIPARLAG